jgi:hypothetical protein
VDPAYCKFGFTLCVKWTESSSQLPGAAFVNADLRVAVLQSQGTAIGFEPARLHGTTVGHGAKNNNITISFSQWIADAWNEATTSNKAVIAGAR